MRRALEHGGRFAYPERIVRPDGSIRVLDTVGEAARDAEGKPVGLIGTCRDVTEERLREETIRIQADIVHHMQISLSVWEVSGPPGERSLHLVAYNPATEPIARRSLAGCIGKSFRELFPYGAGGQVETLLLDVARHGHVREASIDRSRNPSDRARALSVKIFPLTGGRVGLSAEDVTEITRARRLKDAEYQVLERIASGAPLAETLEAIVLAIEESSPPMLGSVLLLDADGLRVRHGAAPHLAEAYVKAIDGSPIGPTAGSCGTAAFLRRPVYVEDIAIDPLWDDYRDLALAHGLRSCWSTPILANDGRVLGTFALYCLEPRGPTDEDRALIARATHLAGIAIEQRQLVDQLRALSARVESVREDERTGIAREIHDVLGQALDGAQDGSRVRLEARPGRTAREGAGDVAVDRRDHPAGATDLGGAASGRARRPGVARRDRVAGAGVRGAHGHRLLDRVQPGRCPASPRHRHGSLPHPPGGAHERGAARRGEARRHPPRADGRGAPARGARRRQGDHARGGGKPAFAGAPRHPRARAPAGRAGHRRGGAFGWYGGLRRGAARRGGCAVIKVLVADDHAIVRRGLRQILAETQDILVGGEAASASEVMRLVREQRCSAVILDISLPGANGLELLAEVHKERPELPVLVLTVHSEDQYAVRAIRAGAAGFLTKESAPERLIEAVRKVAGGGRYVSPELAEKLASTLAGENQGAPHERLSDREFEILKMLASGKTVSQVAQVLSLSVKTVSTHRTRILKKMDMRTNAELTQLRRPRAARGLDYRA